MLEIWHNPRCSKSRQALAFIEEAGADVRVHHYLKEAPTPQQLDRVLEALGIEPAALVRMGESVAQDLDLKSRELSRADWLEVLSSHPILIERPVVIHEDGRVVIGRPPESVRELL